MDVHGRLIGRSLKVTVTVRGHRVACFQYVEASMQNSLSVKEREKQEAAELSSRTPDTV